MSKNLDELLRKIGNNVVSLIATSRNLGADYEELIELLRKLSDNDALSGKERMGMRDRIILEHRDKNGNLIAKWDSGWSDNGLTNAGFAEVAGLITADVGGTGWDYIAIGTGTTTPSETDTALVNEVDRKGMDTGYPSVSGSTVTFQSTWTTSEPSGQPYAITELGLFTASSGGTMLNRIV
ncbi:MAG: hypothetical protein QXI36_02080, partial [Candidatus Bathyarchaeia archaeon]